MRISTTAKSVTCAVLTALALAACSSTSDGSPAKPSTPVVSSSTGSSAPVEPSSPTGFPSTSAGSSTGGLTETQAQAALLTAAEVGGGFQETPAQNSETVLPCTPNEPPLAQRFPPDVKAEADFGGLSGKALFSEEIETFADADAVAAVILAGEQGLACGKATVGGAEVTISGPTDLSTQLGTPVDKAEGWVISSSVLNAVLVIVQLGQHLVVFSFGADPSVQAEDLPDSQQIIADGLAKVAAALN